LRINGENRSRKYAKSQETGEQSFKYAFSHK
jgi:hypothetical protein